MVHPAFRVTFSRIPCLPLRSTHHAFCDTFRRSRRPPLGVAVERICVTFCPFTGCSVALVRCRRWASSVPSRARSSSPRCSPRHALSVSLTAVLAASFARPFSACLRLYEPPVPAALVPSIRSSFASSPIAFPGFRRPHLPSRSARGGLFRPSSSIWLFRAAGLILWPYHSPNGVPSFARLHARPAPTSLRMRAEPSCSFMTTSPIFRFWLTPAPDTVFGVALDHCPAPGARYNGSFRCPFPQTSGLSARWVSKAHFSICAVILLPRCRVAPTANSVRVVFRARRLLVALARCGLRGFAVPAHACSS